MMNGMTIKMLPGYEGVMIASFTLGTGRGDLRPL